MPACRVIRYPADVENQEESPPTLDNIALAEFVAAWSAGDRPDVTAFCAQHPECSPGLRDGIEDFLFLLVGIESLSGRSKGAQEHSEGTTLGGFTILREIGRGGMGVVYEAEQQVPKRRVGLKVIRPGRSSESTRRRFRREADLLGRLRHPNIVPIFEVGSADAGFGPQPYYAMEYVDGTSLLEYCRREGDSDSLKLELLAAVCDGVQHAHDHGILHRDLKPGNILVDRAGRPRVLDFGVARVLDPEWRGSTLSTETGALIGTLPYMSPEQVRGRQEELDSRSDIYALGIIGYELLSGSLPYDLTDRSIPEAARIIGEEEPTPLSSRRRALRGDLDTIFLKALAKEPERRYDSATALAADLRRYLRSEPIVARPPSAIYQLSRFARRNPALTLSLAALFLVLLVGVVWLNLALAETKQANQEAGRNLEENQQKSIRLYMERGQWHDALDTIDELIATGSSDRSELGLSRVEALIAVADRAGALAELESLLEHPGSTSVQARAQLMKGDLLLDEWARTADGERLVRDALVLGLDTRDTAYAQALIAPDMPQAVARYEQVLRLDPLHYLARERLTMSLFFMARFDEMHEHCRLLSVLYPQDATPAIAEHLIAALRPEEQLDPELLERAEEQFGTEAISLFQDVTELVQLLAGALDDGFSRQSMLRMTALVTKLGLQPEGAGSLGGVQANFAWGPSFHDGWGRTLALVGALALGDLDRATEISGEIAAINPEGTILYLHGLSMLQTNFRNAEERLMRDRVVEATLLKAFELPALLEGVRRRALSLAIQIERYHWDSSHPERNGEFRTRGIQNIRTFLDQGEAAREERLAMVDAARAFGDLGLAREILDHGRTAHGDDLEWSLQTARTEGLAGAPASAIRYLDEALDRFPGNTALSQERELWLDELYQTVDRLSASDQGGGH